MKKAIKDLSKRELISLICNLPPGTTNIFDKITSCAICGTNTSAKYWYVCDQCNDPRGVKNER